MTMQAVEALTRLLAIADTHLQQERCRRASPDLEEGGPEMDEMDRREIAVSICHAMLNTAIPVARFRAFVEVDDLQPKRSKVQEERAVLHEFTVCAVDMDGIMSGLIGVSSIPTNVRLTIWEQRPDGADMISGYQGQTKTMKYRQFLRGLKALDKMPRVQ
jgi:hypothetical protein